MWKTLFNRCLIETAPPCQHALHILVLSCLALAQPLFDLLSQYAHFLVAQQVEPIQVLFLVFLLTLLIPGAVLVGEHALGLLFDAKVWLQSAGFAAFAFPLFLLLLKRIKGVSGEWLVGIAVLFTLLGAFVYLRYRHVHLFLTILSPAILIIPTLFLTAPSIKGIGTGWRPEGSALERGQVDVPIAMIVFDELPLPSLLDRSGRIDSVRFPNFSALATDATWFQNARTVSESTTYSIPAILTGNYPRTEHGMVATLSNYPDNLFTWLRNSHDLNIFESSTQLYSGCQETKQAALEGMIPLLQDLSVLYLHLVLPDDFSTWLPDVQHTWTNFLNLRGSVKRRHGDPIRKFEAFLEAFEKPHQPSFNFVHLQSPHLPWIYLPSGKRYLLHNDWRLFLKNEVLVQDETLVTLAFQRYLLQVGLADRFVGQLLQKLKATGHYDLSLIIVVSDHGASFRPGGRRRAATEMNFQDILSVPLIIKAPGQDKGWISDRDVQTIDVIPTIADILGVSVPWPTDGVSALGAVNRNESQSEAPGGGGGSSSC